MVDVNEENGIKQIMNVIEVENVSKTYKTHIKGGILSDLFQHRKYMYIAAVHDVSFSVGESEIFGLIGLNGAGKTTLIKLVAGVMKADTGNIAIMREDPFKKSIQYRNTVSLIMGQNNQLNTDLTIMDNILFMAAMYRIHQDVAIQRTVAMREKLMLAEEDLRKQVRMLSLGQRMKGELILSFLHLPKIIFLDEPTLGLDFMAQNAVRHFLADYVQQHKASIILTSHYIKDIEELCERVLILFKGGTIYCGSVEELKGAVQADGLNSLDDIIEEMYSSARVE